MGKVVSAAVVGVMVHQLTPRNCLLVVAALPVFVLLCSFVMREERKPMFGAQSYSHLMYSVCSDFRYCSLSFSIIVFSITCLSWL